MELLTSCETSHFLLDRQPEPNLSQRVVFLCLLLSGASHSGLRSSGANVEEPGGITQTTFSSPIRQGASVLLCLGGRDRLPPFGSSLCLRLTLHSTPLQSYTAITAQALWSNSRYIDTSVSPEEMNCAFKCFVTRGRNQTNDPLVEEQRTITWLHESRQICIKHRFPPHRTSVYEAKKATLFYSLYKKMDDFLFIPLGVKWGYLNERFVFTALRFIGAN